MCDEETTCETFLSEVPGFQVECHSKAYLLGSPIGNIDCPDSIIQQKVAQLQLLERGSACCRWNAHLL